MNGARRVVLKAGLLTLCAGACVPGSAEVMSTQAHAASAAELARPAGLAGTVLGIVEYTRWPGPTRPIVLCIAGQGPLVAELAATSATAPTGKRRLVPRLVAKLAAWPSPLPADCDAVFFGSLDPDDRTALDSLATRPVLTLGLGPAFCEAGGLFCLQPGLGGHGARFAVNADAVSRSGLIVNPRVLHMGRRSDAR